MARVFMELVGDATSAIKALTGTKAETQLLAESTVSSNTEIMGSNDKLALNIEKTTKIWADATTKRVDLMRLQAAEARKLAAVVGESSTQGALLMQRAQSREASAARLTGVPVVAQAGESEAATASRGNAERDISQGLRGGAKGLGGLGGLGFAALAGTSFIGAYVGASALRSVVDAAKAAEASEALLANATKNVGASFVAWKPQIDSSVASLSSMSGFTRDEIRGGMVQLVRSTGNVSEAMKLSGLAADIARGRNIDYNTSALLVSKVVNGNVGLFKRYGVEVQTGATVQEALAAAQRKFAGAAQAYGDTSAGAQAKLNASLTTSKEIIGEALLPTITRLAGEFANWLDKLNKSGNLERDVNTAMHETHDVLQDIHVALWPLIEGFHLLGDAVGGTGNALKLLVEGFAAWKIGSLIANLGLVRAAVVRLGTAETVTAGEAVTADAEIGAAATAALPEVAALAAALLVTIKGYEFLSSQAHNVKAQQGGNIVVRGSDGRDREFALGAGRAIGVSGYGTPPLLAAEQARREREAERQRAQAEDHYYKTHPHLKYPGVGSTGGTIDKFTLASLPQHLQNEIARAVTPAQKRRADEDEAAAITKLLDTKGALSPAARTEALKERAKAEAQIGQIDKAQAAATKAAARAAATAVGRDPLLAKAKLDLAQGETAAADRLLRTDKARLEEELSQAKTSEMRLALMKQLTQVEKELQAKDAGFVESKKLQVAQARADALAALTGNPTKLQLRLAEQLKEQAMKAINSHRLTMEGLIQAWQAVQQANSVIAGFQGQTNTYHAVSAKSMVDAVAGLTRAQKIQLEEEYSQAQAHRGYAPRGPAAEGQEVHVHIHSDIDQTITKIDKKKRQRHQRAGGRR